MADHHALHDYWFPVALSSAVEDAPVGIKLLDQDIVLWRAADGLHAFRDLCIHRGTKLSLGWVDNGQLVCPYHGWCYGHDGGVTRIPSVPPDRPIPAKARAETYHCSVRYGLVFVCIGTPKQPIYEIPEFSGTGFGWHIVGPVYWQAGATRSFENFFDEAHLPWAHPGLLGDRKNVPVIPTRNIKVNGNSFYFEYETEAQDRLDPAKTSLNLLTYDIVLPYTLYHEHVNPQQERVLDLFFVTPVSKNQSIRFMLVGRNFGLDQPPDKFIAFTTKVWEQDRLIVESQRPEQVPIDLKDELHVRGPDGPAVAYRKLLSDLGIPDTV
jgi:phenylpropionate dioxygenase-like ring-hydroxylating dioxygenase large terminal subunit